MHRDFSPGSRLTAPAVTGEYPVHDTLSKRYRHLKRITYEKFHVVWHAGAAVGKMRRIEQRSDRSLRGALLKDRSRLSPESAVTSTPRSPR